MNQPPPDKLPDRDLYEEVALVCITLICERCQATLDPDDDLGPGNSFATPEYYVLLADEALRRGWLIERSPDDYYVILCPKCRSVAPAGR